MRLAHKKKIKKTNNWSNLKKIFKIGLFSLAGFVYLNILFFLSYSVVFTVIIKANPPVSSIMLYRRIFDGTKWKPVQFVPLEDIPDNFEEMVVWLEDSRYDEHHGIDLIAIREAIEVNRQYGDKTVGASTVTQQLARTMFLYPTKSYFRKYLEIILALEMELFLDKDRILEIYINYIEWGKGVYGAEAAAEYYFGNSISSAYLDQKMRLATIISSPLRYGVYDFSSRAALSQRYGYLCGRYLSTTWTDDSEDEDQTDEDAVEISADDLTLSVTESDEDTDTSGEVVEEEILRAAPDLSRRRSEDENRNDPGRQRPPQQR